MLDMLRDPPMGLRQLAQSAGVDVALLSRIKDGTRSLTPTVATKIAKALDGWAVQYRGQAKRCTETARALRKGGSDV